MTQEITCEAHFTLHATSPGFEEFSFGLHDQRPFLKLSIKNTPRNKKYLQPLLDDLVNWGKEPVVKNDNSLLEIEITGKRVVTTAIEFVLSDSRYHLAKNEDCKKALKKFLKYEIKQRRGKKISHPIKSKSIDKYSIQSTVNTAASHKIQIAKKNKRSSKSLFFIKKDNRGKITEVEALISSYYRLLMGFDRAPQMKSLYFNDKRIGISSKEINGFYAANFNLWYKSTQTIVAAGAVEMLVASYILEEADLHKGNWGFNADGKIVRVDFDRSFWPLTSKYAGLPPHKKDEFHPPANSFPITECDLINFPSLKNTKPLNWWQDSEALKKMSEFEHKKWRAFLKAILLYDNPVIRENANAYLGSNNSRIKYSTHLNERLSILKQKLVNIPQFQLFIKNYPEVLGELMIEFGEYNKHIKDKDKNLRIDITTIRQAYEKIVDAITLSPSNHARSAKDDFDKEASFIV